ncbi:hypothetical protein RJZ56_007367 [Blastomyces dermatitidis]
MSHESSQTYVSYDSTDNNEKTSEDVKKAAVIQVVLSHSMKLNTEQISESVDCRLASLICMVEHTNKILTISIYIESRGIVKLENYEHAFVYKSVADYRNIIQTEVSGDHIKRVSNGEEDRGELLVMSEFTTPPVRVLSDLHSIGVRQNARSAAKRCPRLLARQGYYVRA